MASGGPIPTHGTPDAKATGGADSGEANGEARHGGAPVFECILLFGGISDGSVIGVSTGACVGM